MQYDGVSTCKKKTYPGKVLDFSRIADNPGFSQEKKFLSYLGQEIFSKQNFLKLFDPSSGETETHGPNFFFTESRLVSTDDSSQNVTVTFY